MDYRPWIAALLSFLQPGLGHAYIRAYRRGVTWFLVWAAVTAAFVDIGVPELTVDAVLAALTRLFTALGGLGLVPSMVVAAVTAFAMVDAYRLAQGPVGADPEDGPRCPACGKELDEELEFCPWCTTELG